MYMLPKNKAQEKKHSWTNREQREKTHKLIKKGV